ncbi:hypothetical protein P3T37_003193 [Kitasatospora sp. MAA4]|uniref:hypothetical protein n=1 Tax=Kitasatospora sp. MAA4 TaxID=3035093 RepID=UPI002475782D|nr:hypothetical protein [Kitasatospora sp. MAA4]MDH6133795.1 hypothetical protein [Kitasatospora sp. MAA4]
MRRVVLTAAAVVLLVESLVLGLVGLIMGVAASRQHMSIGGLSSSRMAMGSWIGQGALAVFLLVCAVLVALSAGRTEVRPAVRILLLVCAVFNAVLAALAVALSGWASFGLLIVLTGVLVLAVMLAYGRPVLTEGSPAQR